MTSSLPSLPGAAETATMRPDDLRAHFLVSGIFQPGAILLHHVDLDRLWHGGAVPVKSPLPLRAPEFLRSEYFLERREAGVLNIGGSGHVRADGTDYRLANRDLVYLGRGTRDVTFHSDDPAAPACFYIVTYPAHASFPTTRLSRADAQSVELGDAEHANRRTLVKYVHEGGIQSAQLVMGITELQPGSVWNTMPPHTHHRRTETYLYFDLPADAAVVHLLGEPQQVRSVIARDREIVLSPRWSIHAGCGTTNYAFCWSMGGENQDFTDMQPVSVGELR